MIHLVQSSQDSRAKFSAYWNKNYQFLTRNPKLFLMRKVARLEAVRSWINYFSKGPDKSYEIGRENPSVFKNIDVDLIVSSLKTDSYYPGLNLPQDVLQNLLEFANSTTCYGSRDIGICFFHREKEYVEALREEQFTIASYLNSTEACPALQKLETDSGLLAIAAQFLEADPIHVASELLWSFPVSATLLQQLEAAQVFHYDMDDYRFIKFFFYLTDVDPSSGPHVCIRGSHKNKKFSHQLLGVRCASKDDREIVEYYGPENVVMICGQAGFGFVEDSFCFHKGTPPREKARLLLQIEFATNDYGDLRNF